MSRMKQKIVLFFEIMISHKTSKQELNLKYLIPLVECPNNTLFNHLLQFPQTSQSLLPNFKQVYKKNSQKHRKHRKPSVDRQFSEDQQPVQPQNQQSQDNKANPKKAGTFNDLAYYPQGSILSLKSCNLQVQTKRSGKVDVAIEILSEQSHKVLISQLFDPGFSMLSIKRDKNQTQIIQYLKSTKKSYKFVICWPQATQPQRNNVLREIALEANQKQRIMGWHNDHIKIHIMSLRQLEMIERFALPTKFASQAAADSLFDERLILIIQYPQTIFEIKDNYRPFASISRKKEAFTQQRQEVSKEEPQPNQSLIDVPFKLQIDQKKQWYQNIKVVYQGWDDKNTLQATQQIEAPATSTAEQNQSTSRPLPQETSKSNIPEDVEKIRLHFGFKPFEPILSDESDEESEKAEPRDLATELLNQLFEYDRKTAASPISHSKEMPYQYHQGYYSQNPPQHYHSPPMNSYWSNQHASTFHKKQNQPYKLTIAQTTLFEEYFKETPNSSNQNGFIYNHENNQYSQHQHYQSQEPYHSEVEYRRYLPQQSHYGQYQQ